MFEISLRRRGLFFALAIIVVVALAVLAIATRHKMNGRKGGDAYVLSIYIPDGRPAVGAILVLVNGGQRVCIVNASEVHTTDCKEMKTDVDGRVCITNQTKRFEIVILHSQGYSLIDEKTLAQSKQITLQGWGCIKGHLKIGNKPAAGQTIAAWFGDPKTYNPQNPYISYECEVKTNNDGQFVFASVPTGDINVSQEIMLSSIGMYSRTQKVHVQSGQTIDVMLGGQGRPIIGRVEIPPLLASRTDWSFWFCTLASNVVREVPPMPQNIKAASLERQAEWWEMFAQTATGKAFFHAEQLKKESSCIYPVEITQDGHFRAEDIISGTYTLSVNVVESNGPRRSVIAKGSIGFAVPQMAGGRSDRPMEVPIVYLKSVIDINVGDEAPDFSVRTLNGDVVKLSECRGKYVLLDFWATWCGPCVDETENLKGIYKLFGKSRYFIMIGLSLDPRPDAPMQYAKENGLAWGQGFLGDWADAAVVNDYNVQSIPSIWLIGPDGRVIAKDLRGEHIKNAVVTAMERLNR